MNNEDKSHITLPYSLAKHQMVLSRGKLFFLTGKNNYGPEMTGIKLNP